MWAPRPSMIARYLDETTGKGQKCQQIRHKAHTRWGNDEGGIKSG